MIAITLSALLAAPGACESLKSLALPNTTITHAALVPAGPFVAPVPAGRDQPVLPAHCRIGAVLAPSSDSHIEIAVAAKAIVAAFYQRGPRLSYFSGCSTGGRQGLMEAQRYPDDFDAIIAGAPVNNMLHLSASQMWPQVEMLKDQARIVPANKVTLFA